MVRGRVRIPSAFTSQTASTHTPLLNESCRSRLPRDSWLVSRYRSKWCTGLRTAGESAQVLSPLPHVDARAQRRLVGLEQQERRRGHRQQRVVRDGTHKLAAVWPSSAWSQN